MTSNGYHATLPAVFDGHRSIRLVEAGGTIGLATTTYAYQLSHEDRQDAARRIAAMWNLCAGLSTEELVAAAEAKTGAPVAAPGARSWHGVGG